MDTHVISPALEKGVVYNVFRQRVVSSYRQANLGSRLITLDTQQLPTNSVLHVIDQFLNPVVTNILPDLTMPFIANEKFQLYLENVLTIPGKKAPFPIDERYQFRPTQFNQAIRGFWIQNRNVKRPPSLSAMLQRTNTLPIVNYNAILTVRILGGTFGYYRHFDLVMRTILNTMMSINHKHQWLVLPMSPTVYRKAQFAQTFDTINYMTVRIRNDPSFFLLIHLINFVSKTATISLFRDIPEDALDTINLVFTAGDKAIIYNLGDLHHYREDRHDNNLWQIILRHITTLKLAGHTGHDISTLTETEYDDLVDTVAPTEDPPPETASKGGSPPPSAVPTEPVKTKISIPSSGAPPSKTTHKEELPSNVPKPPVKSTVNPVPEPPITHPPHHDTERPKSTEPAPVHPSEHTEPDVVVPQTATLPRSPVSLVTAIDHGARDAITAATHLTEPQKAAAMKASQVYKTLEIDGIPIIEHLSQATDPPVGDTPLEFLDDKIDDPSMLKSTAINLDKHYLDHVMAKDVAAVLAQGATHGMFLVHVEHKDEVTELDRIRHYKVAYQDLTGRRHSMTFKYPIVSPDGTMMIQGIERRMIKQQVNLPICKIDDRRVSLASNYNKTLVERIGTRAHTFSAYISRYIAQVYKAKVGLTLSYGDLEQGALKLPYDYSSLARYYSTLTFQADHSVAGTGNRATYNFTFNYGKRFDYLNDLSVGAEAYHEPDSTVKPDEKPDSSVVQLADKRLKALQALEQKFGVYCGTARIDDSTYRMFFGYDNQIRFVRQTQGKSSEVEQLITTFTPLFISAFEDKVPPPTPLSEWTELKILDKNFPIVFILGFEYGLQRVLDHIKLDYEFLPSGKRISRTPTTLVVPFADGNLVFDRYPLVKSFVISGLLKFNTKPYTRESFNTPDIYYTLLHDSGISLNYLKGISDFFKLFIDPITRDVLLRMGEPIEVGRLLIRATEMLTTEEAVPAASMSNHRLRGYERFATTLYNEMARSYATYSRQRGNRKSYSINPESVFLRLIQDQTLHIVEEINPVENVKDKHAATYTGGGGRTAQSFVIADRQYPKDGVGILSEATPDSGKVAINTYITADPIIANVRGMYDLEKVDPSKLEPAQLLSVSSLLMPGATNDDGKRSAMLSIQLKHHVPSEYSETMRIRTGYEAVLAHRTGETFACTATRDGVVETVDEKLGMIKVQYTPTKPPVLDLSHVANTQAIRTKFVELAKHELADHNPIYIAQADGDLTTFHLHDIYTFNGLLVQVVDILPLNDPASIPMGEYLTDAARDALRSAKQPVLIKLISITHNPSDDVDVFKFGTKFTSAAGSFVKQTVVCNVKAGDKFKRGDVLAYNSGFFELDPFDPRQVTWKHGVMANVVLMESNDTVEDSDAITADFSRRLSTASTHLRTLKVTNNTIIRNLKTVGEEVQTTDLLCVLEDADIAIMTGDDDHAMVDMLASLSRKAPRARYHGTICEIDVLYACPISSMHPTLAAIVSEINHRKHSLAQAAKGTHKSSSFAEPGQVPIGTKYHGIEFDQDTVILMFYISEEITHGAGDKSTIGLQMKTVCANVIEKPISTESGVSVDMLFSARSVNNRVVFSPLIIGFTNRIMASLEKAALKLYFDT